MLLVVVFSICLSVHLLFLCECAPLSLLFTSTLLLLELHVVIVLIVPALHSYSPDDDTSWCRNIGHHIFFDQRIILSNVTCGYLGLYKVIILYAISLFLFLGSRLIHVCI